MGSQDTTDCDSDTEAVIANVAAAVDYAGDKFDPMPLVCALFCAATEFLFFNEP